jgi:hypothetical protein
MKRMSDGRQSVTNYNWKSGWQTKNYTGMCHDCWRDRERIYLSANRGKRHKAKIETASKVPSARMAIRGVRFAADRGLTPWACKPREVSCAAKALLELNNPLNLIDVHVHCRPQVQVETLPQMTVVYVRSQADH